MKEKEGKKMAAPIYEQLQQRKKEIEKRQQVFPTKAERASVVMCGPGSA